MEWGLCLLRCVDLCLATFGYKSHYTALYVAGERLRNVQANTQAHKRTHAQMSH